MAVKIRRYAEKLETVTTKQLVDFFEIVEGRVVDEDVFITIMSKGFNIAIDELVNTASEEE